MTNGRHSFSNFVLFAFIKVRICVRTQCHPLQEKQFRPIICDNFYTGSHFWFELDHSQVERLIFLFTSTSNGGLRTNLSSLPNKWQSTGNASSGSDPKPSDASVQGNQLEGLGWDDVHISEYGSSSRCSSNGYDGDFNLPETNSEPPDLEPANMNIGCSNTSPYFDEESQALESHIEEIKENDDLDQSSLKDLVANNESLKPSQDDLSNDIPCGVEKNNQDDGLLVLDPSSPIKDGMISPTSFDINLEIAEVNYGCVFSDADIYILKYFVYIT